MIWNVAPFSEATRHAFFRACSPSWRMVFGQTYEVRNSDRTLHDVHSMTTKNNTFNSAAAGDGRSKVRVRELLGSAVFNVATPSLVRTNEHRLRVPCHGRHWTGRLRLAAAG